MLWKKESASTSQLSVDTRLVKGKLIHRDVQKEADNFNRKGKGNHP